MDELTEIRDTSEEQQPAGTEECAPKKRRPLFHRISWQLVIICVLCVLLGLTAARLFQVQKAMEDLNQSQSLYILQAEQCINEQYVGDIDSTAMKDTAIAAMIESLGDRWSYYIPAEEYASYVNSVNNQYVGIGVTVQVAQGQGILVTAVTEGGPAQKAGILAEDVLVAADEHSLVDIELDEATGYVKGEEGTTVDITLLRDGETLTYTVTRKAIDIPIVSYEMLEDSTGYIKVDNFNAKCAEQTIDAIDALVKQGAAGLIFDMRFNGGGRLTELLEILDYLLPEGEIFYSRDKDGNESSYTSNAACINLPMVTIVNSETYSAAEFFAAALQEVAGAGIVGEETSGKGRSQQTFTLSDGSAVAVSTREYFTPDHKSLIGTGVTLDKEVTVDDNTFAAIYYGVLPHEEDTQLTAAKELLLIKAVR